tara:strand:- start:117 stop:590 length:474 start_codon:yes stop_codon:yes gene_type:complete
MAEFDGAIGTVLEHEGGYVNDAEDPGGETKFGISKRSYPDVNIATLTEVEARDIYRRDFWDAGKYYRIDDQAVAGKVFDLAVNMGIRQANKLIQRAVRAASGRELVDDGILGPLSFGAINLSPPAMVLAALRSEAAGYYRLLDKPRFLRGWLNRAYS